MPLCYLKVGIKLGCEPENCFSFRERGYTRASPTSINLGRLVADRSESVEYLCGLVI